jgi:hypothetical protein
VQLLSLFKIVFTEPCTACYLLALYLLELTWSLFSERGRRGKVHFFLRCGTGYGIDYWTEDIQEVIDTCRGAEEELNYPTEEDFAYICQSPVFNYDIPDWSENGQRRNREYHTCLGPFASWIIDDGESKNKTTFGNPTVWTRSGLTIREMSELLEN